MNNITKEMIEEAYDSILDSNDSGAEALVRLAYELKQQNDTLTRGREIYQRERDRYRHATPEMSGAHVLVCGGRNYDNRDRVFHVLDSALEAAILAERPFVLIHGGAKGADALSSLWASTWKNRFQLTAGGRERLVEERVFKADWATHGRAAGPIRNRLMFTESDPDVIIAFEGGAGTANMASIGMKSGCPIYEVKE